MKFRVERIESILAEQLSGCAGVSNPWHGLSAENLTDHLVLPPRSLRFRNTAGMGVGYRWLWVVFDERPESPQEGYLVVYDPRAEVFGLALKPVGKRWGTFIGFYGNLRMTLEAM